jgi:hypothetical protein
MKAQKDKIIEKDKTMFELQMQLKKLQDKSKVRKTEEEMEKQQKQVNT